MFWQKKNYSNPVNSDEFEKLLKRIIGLEADVWTLRTQINNLSSSLASLRGLINRKIGTGTKDGEIEKDLNDPSVYI